MKTTTQKPNFINVGPGRCATTWMYVIFKAHPDITMAMVKETEFFNTNFEKGMAWYENHFPPTTKTAIGEISNAYYVDHLVPDRIRNYNPAMKIVFNLRRPIDLLQSYYGFAIRRGIKFQSVAEALATPIGRIMGSGYEFRRGRNRLNPGDKVSLLDSVLLSQFIKPFQHTFPKNQIHFFVYERLRSESERVLREMYGFLGVDDQFVPDVAEKVINAAIVPRSKIVARFATKFSFALRRIGAYHILSCLHRSDMIKALFYTRATETSGDSNQTLTLDQKTQDLLDREEEKVIALYSDLAQWWRQLPKTEDARTPISANS